MISSLVDSASSLFSLIPAVFFRYFPSRRFCEVRLPEYGRYRLVALVELISELFKDEREDRLQVIQQIEASAREL